MNQFMYCNDLTIRSYVNGLCLQNGGGGGNLFFSECISQSNNQLWDREAREEFIDDYGITQTKLAFSSHFDGNCMWGPNNSGYLQGHACNQDQQMYFFFRTKGGSIRSGYMVSQLDTNQCLQANTSDPNGKIVDVITRPCGPGQQDEVYDVAKWNFHESGEIVNNANGCCLNTYWNHDGTHIDGELFTDACDYVSTTTWRTLGFEDGSFEYYQNIQTGFCMIVAFNLYCNVNATDGNFCGSVTTSACTDVKTQRFEFLSDDWNPVQVTSTHGEL